MLRANRPILAFFDAIKALRIRQLALILKSGYDPNLLLNARGQNGLQFMIHYFGATDAHYRLQAPINKSAYLSIAKLLLDSGLDPNATDLLTDETVLFDAIRYNDKDMVALLLNYVDLALRNKNGETALMCSARFGSKQVTRLILDHLRQLEMDGYFLRQRNRFGLTALEIARAENLESAKVLTKHLLGFGQHAGAVLARSVSQHQLAATAAEFAYGPPVLARHQHQQQQHHRRRNADLLAPDECFSPSDYDSDILAPPRLSERRATGRPAAALGYPFYDPKAAEFSRYLLDQQMALDSSELAPAGCYGGPPAAPAARQRAGPARHASDEEELYGGVAGGQLVRSRSCMLGPGAPGAGSKTSVYGTNNKKADQAGTSKMPGGWQDQSGGGGPGGAAQ